MNIETVDAVLNDPRWAPRHGWHDDHRAHDRTAAYLPAMMQVRSEFAGLLNVVESFGLFRGKMLQLGVGECPASHVVWSRFFAGGAVTVDFNGLYAGDTRERGGDTHDPEIRGVIERLAPFDFLFVDAGHTYDDVCKDYGDYAQMVRPGGLVAFHDALPRAAYPEVEVWRFLDKLGTRVRLIGIEVGIAWVRRE